MRSDGRNQPPARETRRERGAVWLGVSALGCLLALMLGGCGQGSARGISVPPAATVSPSQPLTWQPITQPHIFSTMPGLWPAMDVSPSDGNTVYACPAPGGGAQLWSSHDRGRHWALMSALPQGHPGGCALVADAIRANSLIAMVTWYDPGAGPPDAHILAYLTEDGGRTWRALGDRQRFAELATVGGTAYALRHTGPDATLASVDTVHLAASTDGMRTWRTVDSAILSADQSAAGFWLNPSTGGALAVRRRRRPLVATR
jgi:hypothetical protein